MRVTRVEPDMNEVVGRDDLLFVTLDTLRWDVAHELHAAGRLPNLARVLPAEGFERRHTPGSFTYAAHQAFFAGFLPTPATPGRHPRLFSLRFSGSETTSPRTCVLDAADLVHGLAERGYATACIGGTGFFNLENPLGCVLPGLFAERWWSRELGVTDPRSTEHQVDRALEIRARIPGLLFLFLNVSALHQPNRHYLAGASVDSRESHAAALEYVDGQLGRLFDALARRARRTFCIVCSDHGTAYGEEGFVGHRLAHAVVWDVPYAHFFVGASSDRRGTAD